METNCSLTRSSFVRCEASFTTGIAIDCCPVLSNITYSILTSLQPTQADFVAVRPLGAKVFAGSLSLGIGNGIGRAGLGKSLQAQQAAIARATGDLTALIATPRQLIGHAQRQPTLDDLRFRPVDQRRVDVQRAPVLRPRLRRQVRC